MRRYLAAETSEHFSGAGGAIFNHRKLLLLFTFPQSTASRFTPLVECARRSLAALKRFCRSTIDTAQTHSTNAMSAQFALLFAPYSALQTKIFCLNYSIDCRSTKSTWCGWRDLNPHASRRQNLNLVRLPISPHPHSKQNGVRTLFACAISKTQKKMREENDAFFEWNLCSDDRTCLVACIMKSSLVLDPDRRELNNLQTA